MYKIILITSLFIASFSLHAFDDERELLKETINVTHLNPTPLIMKKSILRVLIQNNWIIKEHTKNTILAQYKTSFVKVLLKDQTVILAEVETEHEFDERWMSSLKRHFIKDITFHYHVKKAKQQLNL
jgi:hypothetical protein